MTLHPVLLVGAGPGDPELLTLKAARAIAQADVILVDDLVNPAVLEHARADVRVTQVGKRGGCRSTPQAFIERLMVREALAGARVVRLKGGDPLVFGRAGEEIEALHAAGLTVQIINGVTSALAAAASLEVSLTHRDHSHGLVFVTGHPRDHNEVVQWAALAASGLTLVIYMGITRAGHLCDVLLRAGLAGDMPSAVVSRAGCADESTRRFTLAQLHALFSSGLAGEVIVPTPALLLIGRVMARSKLAARVSGAASRAAARAQTTAVSSTGSSVTTRLRPSVLAR